MNPIEKKKKEGRAARVRCVVLKRTFRIFPRRASGWTFEEDMID